MLVGCKLDLEHKRTVSMEEARCFAEAHGIHYMETSAKDTCNVEHTFTTIVGHMYDAMDAMEVESGEGGGKKKKSVGAGISLGKASGIGLGRAACGC